MTKAKVTLMCHTCATKACRKYYPNGIPDYCMAITHSDVLEKTKREYASPDTIDIYIAGGKVVANGYGRWPRIQEAIEFAKELKLKRIGLASCVSMLKELELIAELFTGAGFEVTTIACQIGRVAPKDRGVEVDTTDHRGYYCNPIAQAEIMNKQNTQLNFMIGLCLGHDIIFTQHSKAPVSTLIVKDRALGHNPAAALYSSYLRKTLMKQYCNKDTD